MARRQETEKTVVRMKNHSKRCSIAVLMLALLCGALPCGNVKPIFADEPAPAASGPSYEQCLQQGAAKYEKGDYAGARQLFQQALDKATSPHDQFKVHYATAQCYSQEKKYNDARQSYLNILTLPDVLPKDKIRGLQGLAICYQDAGKIEDQRRTYQKLLAMPGLSTEDRANAQFWLGDTFLKQKKWNDALSSYRKVLQMPKAPTSSIGLAHMGMGDAYAGLKKKKEAKQHYNIVLKTKGLSSMLYSIAQLNLSNLR